MDASLEINLSSLFLSILAVALSGYLAYRQALAAHGANLIPIIFTAFREWRQDDFARTQSYILHELSTAHDPAGGYAGIPEPLRRDIDHVTIFYDDLGKLVAYKAVDPKVVISTFGLTIVRVWDVLRPYIYREREIRGTQFMALFEDLACRAKDEPPSLLHRRLGLRKDTS
ncbi:hypothetical protein OG607_14085 [Streptomyces sp. NBC_01537]|uniref:DUF4760 domain-containing protein n=1 Tax=Streptomyces sp. NBC_01537 TaxID=2903896 RepID=UPI003865346F